MADVQEIRFVEAPADPNKGFRIGHAQSVFQNNVTFTVTGYKLGSYQIIDDAGNVSKTKYSDSAQNIVLTTSVDEDLPLNRLLHKKTVIYDAQGSAKVIHSCDFQAPLMKHMLQLGRRTDNASMLVGTVEEVAKHAKKFFDNKTIVVQEHSGFAKDDKGKLVTLISPCVSFHFKKDE